MGEVSQIHQPVFLPYHKTGIATLRLSLRLPLNQPRLDDIMHINRRA